VALQKSFSLLHRPSRQGRTSPTAPSVPARGQERGSKTVQPRHTKQVNGRSGGADMANLDGASTGELLRRLLLEQEKQRQENDMLRAALEMQKKEVMPFL